MIKLTLTDEKLSLIKQHKLTIDEFYILFCKALKKDTSSYRPPTYVYNSLVEKKMFTKNKQVSKLGRETVEAIQNISIRSKKSEELFNQFWELYPKNDSHSIYPRTCTLRENKPKCKLLYLRLIQEGYNGEQINKALSNEVNHKMATSIRDNQLKFMKKSINWLSNRSFEGWMDDIETTSNEEEFIDVL